MDDIILNKKESIERCIKQIREYYALPAEIPFAEDHLKQDAIALNLQRACQQCIDLANHVIRIKRLGLPKTSKESFQLLSYNRLISNELCTKLEGMVGFRNVLIHEYQHLNIKIMISVIEKGLDDMLSFADYMIKTVQE